MILKLIIRIVIIIGIAALAYFLVTGKDAAEVIAPGGEEVPAGEVTATSTSFLTDLFKEGGMLRNLIDRFKGGSQ